MLEIHTLVIATDEGYGQYIGEVVGFRKYPAPVYFIKILACTRYPSQVALLVNVAYRREPFPYHSINTFSSEHVHLYHGIVPDYEISLKDALEGMALCHH